MGDYRNTPVPVSEETLSEIRKLMPAAPDDSKLVQQEGGGFSRKHSILVLRGKRGGHHEHFETFRSSSFTSGSGPFARWWCIVRALGVMVFVVLLISVSCHLPSVR